LGINNAKSGKLLYHLTKLSNLDSIVENGLTPRKVLLDNGITFGDVANQDIISKRTQLGLDIYTPFHFHPYSSFDVAVKNTYANFDFVYICIKRDLARENNFKVLIKHPLSIDECTLYSYDEGISLIDWDVLMETGRHDDHAKHVKMAECLTDSIVPAKHFHSIVVKDNVVENKVQEIFEYHRLKFPPPYIGTQNWF